ncbi:hypothetical protein [Exiguobacterium aurantiacum]|uniref:Uncharacterized protein n=1 Tax=Exiguobacterium aurantiacum TaxID=33987 RepID=A0ABY5FMR0_9BACL|nr:hypothetical protein [Exiguobacterium aurantiacum]UTT42851.1 hypothetical protein NMQ00_15255 [Exiguobacterium aurantiacum]
MHHFEIGNEIETHRFTIVGADRNTLTVDLFGHREGVHVADYVRFVRALTEAYTRLDGRAELVSEIGNALLTLTFKRGQVEVRLVRDRAVRAFRTNQSYVMPALAQIGIVE